MIRAARIAATVVGLAIHVDGDSASLAQGATREPVLLSWLAPESSGCPDAAYVLSEVRRFVGAGAAPHRAPISATATIRAGAAGGFQMILTTVDGDSSGERTFRDESCRALADAAVVILVWMVAPEADARGAEPAPPPTAAPSVAAGPANPAPPPSSKAGARRPYLGLGAVADAGTLPAPALGAEARLGLSFRGLRLEAHAAYWPARRKELPALANGDVPGASFALGAAGIEACAGAAPEASSSRIALALCLGPELDLLNGTGFGVTTPTRASKTWLSFSGGIEVRVALMRPLTLFLSVAGVVPTAREHFALRGVGELYRPSPVAARGTLGLALDP